MEEQKEYYMTKPKSCPLGKSKVVYEKEDEKNAIVIRNLYPEGNPSGKIFGMRKPILMKELSFTLMQMFHIFFNTVNKAKLKNLSRGKVEMMKKAIFESKQALKGMKFDLLTDEEEISMRIKLDGGFVNITLNLKARHPYFTICNENTDRDYLNSVSLFSGEAVKLMEYLDTQFNFLDSDSLKVKKNTKDYSSDDFF